MIWLVRMVQSTVIPGKAQSHSFPDHFQKHQPMHSVTPESTRCTCIGTCDLPPHRTHWAQFYLLFLKNGWYLMIIIWQGTVTLLIRWVLYNLLVQERWVFSLLKIALRTPRASKIGGVGELLALPEGRECNNPFLLIHTNPLGTTGD